MAESISKLKRVYYKQVEKYTPDNIKNNLIIDLKNPGEIKLELNAENIKKWKLEEWFEDYKKIAMVSTGGIRGPQNIKYYWDFRFPINQLGVALATISKNLVLKEKIKNRQINKIASGEVRYNTKEYIELISRIQAHQGIKTHQPLKGNTTTIWMASFLIFMLDYDGGEYVTSSHAISSKIATKDLDDEGSQFSPELSMQFMGKLRNILDKAKKNSYTIELSKKKSKLIKQDFEGYDLYVKYLKKGVAAKENLDIIKKAIDNGFKLMFELSGGCMYKTTVPILKRLGILKAFEWWNEKEDPFFHGIGKTIVKDPKTGEEEIFDLSCDATLLPVVKTMHYEKILKDKPIGYVVMITDPDGDRLVVGQIEEHSKIKKIERLGINYIKIDDKKIFSVYHPTDSFLMVMDFYAKLLKNNNKWQNHPRFMITTTPSSRAWNEWANNHNVKIITTPVGFKEIAMTMQKIEKQIIGQPDKDVVLHDIWDDKINLGTHPRLFFGGEESGGMIIGPEELIKSKKGRTAIAMREKSAGEASIITTALAADLFLKKKFMSDYLAEIFKENNIKYEYYIRDDIVYYNESEANPVKLKKTKQKGEILRDKLDSFYLGLAFTIKKRKEKNIEQIKKIFSDIFNLDFSDLKTLKFTGDATYIEFEEMFVQIRRSGTDAKMRGYSNGSNKERCKLYLDKLLHYSGKQTLLYKKFVPSKIRDNIYKIQLETYTRYRKRDS